MPGNSQRPPSCMEIVITLPVAVERRLDAVTVVRVDIHVGDAQAAFPQGVDGDDRVVEDAKARRRSRTLRGGARPPCAKAARAVPSATRRAACTDAPVDSSAASYIPA